MISESTEVFSFITGGCGIIWSGWKYGIKPLIKKENEKKLVLSKKIDYLVSEMTVDGNGSMKTAVIGLKNAVEKIHIRMDSFEDNQRLAMNLQGVAFWVSDENGLCIYASPGLCKVMARSEHEILNNNWMTWIHPDDRVRIIEAWKTSVNEQISFDEVYTLKKGDGHWVKVWGVAFPRASSSNVFGGKMGKLVPLEAPYK